MDTILDFNILYKFNNTTNVKVGDILISNPINVMGLFYKTVILITEYDKFGATGFILNKMTGIKPEILYDNSKYKFKIFYGGPISLNDTFILYECTDSVNNLKKINDICYTTDIKILNDLNSNNFKVILGYAAWAPNQLEQELRNDSWVILKNQNIKSILNLDPSLMWSKLLLTVDKKYNIFVNYPINPVLN